jgi:hypothetical protein
MKYIMLIDSQKVLLTHEQVEKIVDAIDGAEIIKSEYVGQGKGDNGSCYINLLDTPKLSELFSMKVLSDVEYGALVTMTEVYKQEKKSS